MSLHPSSLSSHGADGAPPRRLEFHAIYRCVNRCVFCSERDHMERFRDHPATREDIARILAAKRREGFAHVTFTGGEPTLHPWMGGALRLARRLGYRTFLITNGSALWAPACAERILPHLDELCVSVHGPGPELHDRLTGRPGAFVRLARTLGVLHRRRAKLFVMANTVVTRENLPRLPEILRFLTRCRKVRHWLLSHLAPEGEGLRRYAELAVRHHELARAAASLARAAAARGLALRVFGLPACALGPRWRLSNDLYFSPRVTVARAFTADGSAGWFEEPGLLPVRERFQPRDCGGCALQARCGGVFRSYWDRFGPEPLHPYRKLA